ncbi:hypothetical protein L6R53_22265 [Myxococcota bacterium]|nr:hypothetical protein [Myxococcota bacterium]
MTDRALRRALENATNLHIPQAFGDPLANMAPGTILDFRDDDRPTFGAITAAPFGRAAPAVRATGPLDIGLSITRTVNVSAGAEGGVQVPAGSGQASVTFALKSSKDVCVLLDPVEGVELTNLLDVAAQVRGLPDWDHQRFGLVARVFMARNVHVWIAKDGGGSLTIQGKAEDVTRAMSGQISAGVTWTSKNLYEKKFEGPGVFGVHVARVPKKGLPKVL